MPSSLSWRPAAKSGMCPGAFSNRGAGHGGEPIWDHISMTPQVAFSSCSSCPASHCSSCAPPRACPCPSPGSPPRCLIPSGAGFRDMIQPRHVGPGSTNQLLRLNNLNWGWQRPGPAAALAADACDHLASDHTFQVERGPRRLQASHHDRDRDAAAGSASGCDTDSERRGRRGTLCLSVTLQLEGLECRTHARTHEHHRHRDIVITGSGSERLQSSRCENQLAHQTPS